LPADQPFDVNSIIRRLLDKKVVNPHGPPVNVLTGKEIRLLCLKSQEIFREQPMLLELEAPINICGDIHGQYFDLITLFTNCGYPPDRNYLFLGDYVDRGRKSIETICLLLAYKVKYPDNFFILRGNHECPSISRVYGFYEECKKRYSIKLWRVFTDCFAFLPVSALVDDRIFCCHGGLSPHLTSMKQIKSLERTSEIPMEGLLCDLLWADPEGDLEGYGLNDRGVSYTFGEDIVHDFVAKYDLDLVCRAHMVVEDGYEFFANKKLVTIFSAPHYCGQFDNAAALLSVSENLICSFTILKPNRPIGESREFDSPIQQKEEDGLNHRSAIFENIPLE